MLGPYVNLFCIITHKFILKIHFMFYRFLFYSGAKYGMIAEVFCYNVTTTLGGFVLIDTIVMVACVYVLYSNIKALLEVPFAQWELVQWLLVVISVLLVVAGAHRGWVIYKKWKKKQSGEEDTEEGEKEEKPAEKTANQPSAGDVASISLSDLDVLDAPADEFDLDETDFEDNSPDYSVMLEGSEKDEAEPAEEEKE